MNEKQGTEAMFVSDNTSSVCPEVMQPIDAANVGDAAGYGGDQPTLELGKAFSAYFATQAAAIPVGTGTAANAIAIALAAPRFAGIYCHQNAHIETTECGGVESWGGGTKLLLLPGAHGRISADAIKSSLERLPRGRPQSAPPKVVSITQGTEAGTIYSLSQIAEISALAHERGMKVHMDGARFSNALVKLGCSPADMTWRAGIDILSYGATKNGGMCADAVVMFDPGLMEQVAFVQRRNGQMYSKMRYLSVQLLALLRDGVAERNAEHSNKMAERLSRGLSQIPGARLLHPVDINEVFISLPPAARDRLAAARYTPQLRTVLDDPHYRFVTAWNTTADAVDRFVAAAVGSKVAVPANA
jgi:threonine aldolase